MKISLTHQNSKTECLYQALAVDQINTLSNESCELIDLNDCLEYIENYDEVLVNCMSKVTPTGTITLTGYDLFNIAQNLINGQLSGIDFRKITKELVNVFFYHEIISVIKTNRFAIIEAGHTASKYTITIQKT